MSKLVQVSGIHHITAISSDAKKTYDFYTRVLGLRLVKKSVNQDDVSTYHLFFGNKTGEPGMDLTFFPFQPSYQGKAGNGSVSKISLSVPQGSLDFWQKRFDALTIRHSKIKKVFDSQRLEFFDHDNQSLELVETAEFEDRFADNVWTTDEISVEFAIRCFYGATLSVSTLEYIQPIIELLGYSFVDQTDSIHRFIVLGHINASLLEIKVSAHQDTVTNGAGTVHHIAFSVKNETEQLQHREKLLEIGLWPTEIINRYYFKSVYFRIPDGILFELATLKPGFSADEDLEHLGETLALPPFLESRRTEIEAGLERL